MTPPTIGRIVHYRLSEQDVERAEHLGEIAYNAYRASTGGISVATGDVLPLWEHLRNEIRTAWRRSAAAVQSVVAKDVIAGLPASARVQLDHSAGDQP